MIYRLLNSILLLYVVMLWPGRLVIWGVFDRTWHYPQMMYDSGVLSIQFLVLTVAVTPALLLINRVGYGAALGRWLLRRRRHFGLASFIYAALHLLHYVIYTADLGIILAEVLVLEYAIGWAGFVLFAALAVTSNRWSIRALGRRWKVLHNLVYLAAALSFLHWYLFEFFAERVFFWLALFAGSKLVHVGLIKASLARRAGPLRREQS